MYSLWWPSKWVYNNLEFHQGLWFGVRKLANLLINPNQCHVFCLSICDNPFDPHRDLTIHDSVTDIKIPMDMMGTVADVMIHVPTWQEICNCPHLMMTDDKEWDPLTSLLLSHHGDSCSFPASWQNELPTIQGRLSCKQMSTHWGSWEKQPSNFET